ncbi:DNA-binding response OmpR family regulator [Sulfitobacter undariae]|uniref:DNA-binding response OmpR family regulator n=1 Tax=Sulfitobacter undariae TaxID=1563671 RepID=A0A7W6E693_9RHOB|nr:response regulator [Sulfitobacter undariae]MBB3995527.1 DNA-binding response OmpR family regulator [Sulfitobacter undariae]
MSQRIMAVDDSDIAQEFIRNNLAELGFDDVVSFLDPRVALDAIETGAEKADLILMDIMMPGIDGIELCARIRGFDAWRDVPIIMLTSRKDMESLSRAFVAGANDYVTKPFNRIELQARMRSCLRLKSELDRRRASEHRGASRKRLGVDSTPEPVALQALLGNQLGMRADLMSLSAKTQSTVGLIALKIDGLTAEHDISTSQRTEIIQAVAKVLARERICAGDSFAHWEDDLFCFAGLHKNEAQLVECAKGFIQSVNAAKIALNGGWKNTPVSISAAVSPTGKATIGSRLGQLIKLVEANDNGTTSETVTMLQ